MAENIGSCGQTCGCHVDSFPVSRECPLCHKKLRLVGRSQELEFRLNCPSCGYQSQLLTTAEVQELL